MGEFFSLAQVLEEVVLGMGNGELYTLVGNPVCAGFDASRSFLNY